MEQVSIIGIDTSKRSFQLHGSTAEGCPVLAYPVITHTHYM